MEVFTVKELAAYFGCSQGTIRKLVTNKAIPFFNVGRRIFFRKEIIDNWIYNQEVHTKESNSFQGDKIWQYKNL